MRVHASQRLTLWLIVCCLPSARGQTVSNPAAELTNALGMKLVRIPAGEFQMGGQESAKELVTAFPADKQEPEYFRDEYPRHRVRITKPFYLGKYEVTVGQFRQFVQDAGYRTEAERDGVGGWGYNPASGKCEGPKPQYHWRNPGFAQTDNHPVLNVTWHDAAAFCQWLSRKEGKTYRLPTEAEWEYACRAGTVTRYHSGDDPATLRQVAQVFDVEGQRAFGHVHQLVIAGDDQRRFPAPVGRFPPNPFGLHDMHGNAWEWCADWYGEEYYAQSPTNDPPGPESGELRVRRGGGWNSFALWARASFRNWNTPDSRCVNLGFRVARNDG
jgi:formylglycine-generating enzyme required for sulfatase activity